MSSALQLFSIIGVGTQLINVGPIMSHISEIGLVALFWRTGHLQPEMIPNDATSDRCCAQSVEKYHIISPFWSNILMICIWLDHSLCSWLLVTERVHSAQTAKLFLHTLFVRTVQFLRSCRAHVCLCWRSLFNTPRLPHAYPATCYSWWVRRGWTG